MCALQQRQHQHRHPARTIRIDADDADPSSADVLHYRTVVVGLSYRAFYRLHCHRYRASSCGCYGTVAAIAIVSLRWLARIPLRCRRIIIDVIPRSARGGVMWTAMNYACSDTDGCIVLDRPFQDDGRRMAHGTTLPEPNIAAPLGTDRGAASLLLCCHAHIRLLHLYNLLLLLLVRV